MVYVITTLLALYGWLIVLRAILSWVDVGSEGPVLRVRRLLVVVTEPYLGLFRRVLPVVRVGWPAGLDFSTLLGLVVLFIIIQVLARL
jgi:YggT family protein